MLRIRYLRPMPSALIAEALRGARAVGVLEKDVSFGAEGTVFTNVNSALHQAGANVPTYNFIGGLGGDDISESQVEGMFAMLAQAAEGNANLPRVSFSESIVFRRPVGRRNKPTLRTAAAPDLRAIPTCPASASPIRARPLGRIVWD